MSTILNLAKITHGIDSHLLNDPTVYSCLQVETPGYGCIIDSKHHEVAL